MHVSSQSQFVSFQTQIFQMIIKKFLHDILIKFFLNINTMINIVIGGTLLYTEVLSTVQLYILSLGKPLVYHKTVHFRSVQVILYNIPPVQHEITVHQHYIIR